MRAAVKELMGSDAFTAMNAETQDLVVQLATDVWLEHSHARPLRHSPGQLAVNEIDGAGARWSACLARVRAALKEILMSARVEVPPHLAGKEAGGKARKKACGAGDSSMVSERVKELKKRLQEALRRGDMSEYEIARLMNMEENYTMLSELGL